MKRKLITLVGAAAILCGTAYAGVTTLKTKQDKLSYSMGVMTGKAFKSHNVTVNPAAFSAGLGDAMGGKKLQMTQDQMQKVLTDFQKQSMTKLKTEMKVEADKNQQAGTTFLASNAKKSGVKTTDTGLQYKIITAGKGTKPSLNDTVTVDYEGKLTTGKVFDSSYKRGKPVTFPLKGVIKGWQQALQLMSIGSTWEVVIPAKLAYGQAGVPGLIGPNETLVFKVHLISVKTTKQ